VRFISESIKYEILQNTKITVRCLIRKNRDYTADNRKIQKELIPYMKDARGRDHRDILTGKKLVEKAGHMHEGIHDR
jgi:hypothetical protein